MLAHSVQLFSQFLCGCFEGFSENMWTLVYCVRPAGIQVTLKCKKPTASASCVCITDVPHFVFTQAFFVKDYIMNHPEDGEKIGRLRELMFEQVCIKR